MKKEGFIIDVNKTFTDNKMTKVTYCLERVGCVNFLFMSIDEVRELLKCLQTVVQKEAPEEEISASKKTKAAD